jgi:hypothetical protein
MDFEEIKKLNILDYLQARGHQPVKIKYGNAWYLSPFRQENTASFKVNLNKNLWFDFGSGEGGNIISLVMKLCNCSVSGAAVLLNGSTCTIREHHFKPADESGRIRIRHVQPLTSHALFDYISLRRVNVGLAKRFLNEASYSVHGKNYFALAFRNDMGGYELRNAWFKTGSSPKYFTTIPGADDSQINVFEGFMDFLSCCTFYRKVPFFTTIVLNSLSFLPKIEAVLANVKTINLYLDNDPAGRTATKRIMSVHPLVKDWAPVIYSDTKDFNEFLIKSWN